MKTKVVTFVDNGQCIIDTMLILMGTICSLFGCVFIWATDKDTDGSGFGVAGLFMFKILNKTEKFINSIKYDKIGWKK